MGEVTKLWYGWFGLGASRVGQILYFQVVIIMLGFQKAVGYASGSSIDIADPNFAGPNMSPVENTSDDVVVNLISNQYKKNLHWKRSDLFRGATSWFTSRNYSCFVSPNFTSTFTSWNELYKFPIAFTPAFTTAFLLRLGLRPTSISCSYVFIYARQLFIFCMRYLISEYKLIIFSCLGSRILETVETVHGHIAIWQLEYLILYMY